MTWTITKEKNKTYITGRRYIAEVFNYGLDDEETSYPEINESLRREAAQNAKLITAAPEMLAMLKRLITDAERANNGDLHLVRTISDARQLINKIEGKHAN